MAKATGAAMAVSGVIVFIVSIASGFFGFMMWALALNGFSGHQTAINVSMVIFFVLAVISAIISIILALAATRIFAGRYEWNSVVVVLLSAIIFSVVVFLLHMLSVVISAIAAGSMI